MPDYPLERKNYTIQNIWWDKLYVSAGDNDTIVGHRHAFGATQTWKLEYEEGFAIFQGIPDYPAEGKYINFDSERHVLVYSDTPGKFRLEGQGDTFTVSPVTVDQSNGLGPPVGWQLPTGDDQSQVQIASTQVAGAVWKFS